MLVLAMLMATIAPDQALASDANFKKLSTILDLPTQKIDLAVVKLTIDRMIDPNINIANSIRQIDAIVNEVKSRWPANASSKDKLEGLRTFLYQAGPWNNNRPFHYDLNDPFGRNISNKLLPTYLATRKGNCVSMPFLFIILGQRLGIDVTASTAPEHVFVKYRDESGNLYNLEATSGAGFTRDLWMQQQMPMTPKALTNGIYMKALNKKETVVVMMGTLLEFYGKQQHEEHRIELAGLALKYYPKDVSAMLHISAANYQLRQRHFVSKYPTPVDIPTEQRPYLAQWERS